MNIGLFTDTYYPEINGVATSVLMLKIELEEKGHNVYVFTTTNPNTSDKEPNVYRVPSLPCPLLSDRRVGVFYQNKLAKVINGLDLDIIHTHTEFSLGIFGRIMAKKLQIPVIHTYHTIYEDYTHYIGYLGKFDNKAKAAARFISRISCDKAAMVIVPTEKVRELLHQYNVKNYIQVIPSGINIKKFSKDNFSEEEINELRREFNLSKEDKVILYVGRAAKEKNINKILNIMPHYMASRPEVKFLIIGDGPERKNLEAEAANLEIEGKVIFAGERPWCEIGKYYQLGDLFISASQSETQGLTYIEAMASGLPVIAKKDKCLEGLLIDNENGYSFDDEEELEKELDKILYDSENRKRISSNAIRAVESYSSEKYASNIEQVYGEIEAHTKLGYSV